MAKRVEFLFNLLPAPSKEEYAKEERKSNGLLYASLLLFVAVASWLGLTLFNAGVVARNLEKWENTSSSKTTEINSYTNEKLTNGELVSKTAVLKDVVVKHTDPQLVFDTIESRIQESTPNVDILSYGRDPSGNFQVSGETKNPEDVSKLLKDFKEEETVENVSLLSMRNENGVYTFILDLDLIGIGDENNTTDGGTQPTAQ